LQLNVTTISPWHVVQRTRANRGATRRTAGDSIFSFAGASFSSIKKKKGGDSMKIKVHVRAGGTKARA